MLCLAASPGLCSAAGTIAGTSIVNQVEVEYAIGAEARSGVSNVVTITVAEVVEPDLFDFGDAPDPLDATGGRYPTLLANGNTLGSGVNGRWYDLLAWGGTLMITAYAMGTLHERHQTKVQELQETYRGLLMILRQFIAKDKYTENHSYRVSVYAAKIAARMGFSAQRIEDVRAASLLHDIGKLGIDLDQPFN